jgi:hypothetical protein
MARPVNKQLLLGQWLHSREEDTDAGKVYRRPAYFPTAAARNRYGRGVRPGYEFGPDGSLKRIGPGPTDISRVTEGAWQIEDASDEAGAARVRVELDGKPEVMDIETLEPDRMVVRRPEEAG